jgi:hypothetical protein
MNCTAVQELQTTVECDFCACSGRIGAQQPVPPCPLRVRRVGFVMSAVCLVYPKHQTFPRSVGTSHLGHERTSPFAISWADFSEGIHGLVGSERRCLITLWPE